MSRNLPNIFYTLNIWVDWQSWRMQWIFGITDRADECNVKKMAAKNILSTICTIICCAKKASNTARICTYKSSSFIPSLAQVISTQLVVMKLSFFLIATIYIVVTCHVTKSAQMSIPFSKYWPITQYPWTPRLYLYSPKLWDKNSALNTQQAIKLSTRGNGWPVH